MFFTACCKSTNGSLSYGIRTFSKAEIVGCAPFADALVKLKKGDYTRTPVQTTFGWHVIKLEDERAPQLRPYDQVRPQLVQRRMQQLISQEVAELRKKAKIVE